VIIAIKPLKIFSGLTGLKNKLENITISELSLREIETYSQQIRQGEFKKGYWENPKLKVFYIEKRGCNQMMRILIDKKKNTNRREKY